MNQKGFSAIVTVLAIFAGVLFIAGGYFLGQSENTSQPAAIQELNPQKPNTLPTKETTKDSALPLPSQSGNPAPTLNTPNPNDPSLKSYTSTTYSYSLQYPKNWNLTRNKDAEGVPQVVITAPRTPGKLPAEIYIAVNSPYSTSGAVCTDSSCPDAGKLEVLVMGQKYQIPLVQTQKGDTRFLFELPGKKVQPENYFDKVSLTIYASFFDEEDAKIIGQTISSLTY